MDNIPTVSRNGVNLFTFDCKCGKKHTHGYSEGHRVSHLWKNGYYLKEE